MRVSTFVVKVKDRTRGNVTTPMVLWSIAMAVVLFLHEARWGDSSKVVWTGVLVTVALGAYLGWRRRVAAVFVAPFVSWLFAGFPLFVAAMIRDGFFRGLVAGFFWDTLGWSIIGGLEFAGLFAVSMVVRVLHRSVPLDGPEVVVFGPDDPRR